MVYYKTIDGDGFVNVSTVNKNIGGNITQEEYEIIVEMFKNAEEGFGIKETPTGYVYAKYDIIDEPTAEELLDVLLGETE